MHQKLVPDPFLILLNSSKQTLRDMQEILLKIRNLKHGYQKALEKSFYFFFRIESLFMDKVIKNERGLELVTSGSSGYEISSEKFL